MAILAQDKTTINHLGKASDREMSYLNEWLVHIEPFMFDSVSTYAKGRKELHLRNFVKLASSKDKNTTDVVKPIIPSVASQYQSHMIEQIGERLLPGFHQGLVLYYPKGTLIKPHRDSPAYAKGAASINIVGNAKFLISDNQDAANMQSTLLGEGDCIWFDNKQPHAIATVEQDRWCVCFFYLKELQNQPQKQSDQLALFPVKAPVVYQQPIAPPPVKTTPATNQPKGNLMGTDGMSFTKPRYKPVDGINCWCPFGEEIAWAENPDTKEKLHIESAENIPDGWCVVLNYGGRLLCRQELQQVFS